MPRSRSPRLPALPQLLQRKIYKTGQTRGADDDVIYQNRVARSSTVLIPYNLWDRFGQPPSGENHFEKGFLVLVSPRQFFETAGFRTELERRGLVLGRNALLFYEQRSEWVAYDPDTRNLQPALRRTAPLGGEYVARVAAITAANGGEKILRGFMSTASKGAGIRLFEYTSAETIARCRDQLEALYWLCEDSLEIAIASGMAAPDAATRKELCMKNCTQRGLLDTDKLRAARVLDSSAATICPLCLERLSGQAFFSRLEQAEGREVHDLTVTQVNLFHIEELRYGVYNHRPYNLGWGHHHCNVVVKDAGIDRTLAWMDEVIQRNKEQGYL